MATTTPEQEIVEAYERLGSATETARELGVYRQKVVRALKEAGLDVPNPKERKSAESESQVVGLYASGMNRDQIAEEVGCSAVTVSNILARNGVELRPKRSAVCRADRDKEIVEAYKRLGSARATMRELHRSERVVVAALRAACIEFSGQPARIRTEEYEVRAVAMYEEGMPTARIAMELGGTSTLVCTALKNRGVCLRSRGPRTREFKENRGW